LFLAVAFTVLACLVPIAQTAANPPPPAPLGESERAAVDRIQAYLNGIKTVQAEFQQASSNGELARGNLYISRPGRLRIEYQPPVPILVVADGTFLIYYDRELNQVSYIPLGSSPAGILLEDRISLTGGDLMITGFKQEKGTFQVTLVRTENPMEGSLTLILTDSPLTLRQWAVTDAQGIVTNVSLVKAKFGVPLDPQLFRFKNPKIFQDKFD
jgi:outer membrane lipoprotein-sorting protein